MFSVNIVVLLCVIGGILSIYDNMNIVVVSTV